MSDTLGARVEKDVDLPLAQANSFKIVIHLPDGQSTKTRNAILDTRSSVDFIGESLADSLKMTVDPYKGENLVGGTITPLGQLNLDWHVMGKTKTYTTRFLVLNSDRTKDFDVLLGSDTISSIGFYSSSPNVWQLTEQA